MKTTQFEQTIDFVKSLPFKDFKKLVEAYSAHTGTDLHKEMDKMITLDHQQRLMDLGINQECPKCKSTKVVKNGKRSTGIQEFKCKDCNTKFTLFTDTVLEKTRWHWDVWVKVLQMTLNNVALKQMQNTLIDDFGCYGIDIKTVWMWRLKLIHALASIPMPVLTGVIQMDETFVREAQKGSRNLVSFVSKKDIRNPRYGRQSSKYGVMGPEFATVTTAIDDRGYCVCKVSCLGRLTPEIIDEQFAEHITEPTYICTDANRAYEDFCNAHEYPQYIRPSNYLTTLEKNGYVFTVNKKSPDYQNVVRKNRRIMHKLYVQGLLDKINNREYLLYETFAEIRDTYKLSLSRVNELHKDIKMFIYANKTNVSTKYLSDYIGYLTYLKNWAVTNGHKPTSEKDAEAILIDILKAKTNYTITEIAETDVKLVKPSGKYTSLLKEKTTKAREATMNKYFKFSEEDGVVSFNKREFLLDLPKTKLHSLCSQYGISGYKKLSSWTLVSSLLKQPDIEDTIYKLIQSDRSFAMMDEDVEMEKCISFAKTVKAV